MTAPALELTAITKRFGPTLANDAVSFQAHTSQIHTLLGENGAGKSTLMSILSGRYRPDSGAIRIDGQAVRFSCPADAQRFGVGMVHQRFMLVEALTVAENISLAAGGGRLLDLAAEAERILGLARQFGLEVDPARRIDTLSMGERQRVEILKLLRLGARILIFDEPTSVLTPTEIASFCRVLKTLRSQGRTIILITHKLEEALELSDRISILRRGRLVATTTPTEAGSKPNLARMMVGREVLFNLDKPPVPLGEEVLRTRGLTGGLAAGHNSAPGSRSFGGPSWSLRRIRALCSGQPDKDGRNDTRQWSDGGSRERAAFRDVNLRLRQGEILAVVGVAGNGQTELAEALAGLLPCRAGELALAGQICPATQWAKAPKPGLAYVPEDRHQEGSIPALSLINNFVLTQLSAFQHGPLLDWPKAASATRAAMARHAITAAGPEQPSGQLSGGNLQKLLLARELSRKPRLLIIQQPTQGLDVGASEAVWREILAAREHAGVLLITGDLSEALTLADRVAVIFDGAILGEVDITNGGDPEILGPMMAGVRP